jgi:hypothetical protein
MRELPQERRKEALPPPHLIIHAFTEMVGKTKRSDVMAKVKNPAGNSAVEYVLKHPDSEVANKLKDGNWYFFFDGAHLFEGAQKNTAQAVRWDADKSKFRGNLRLLNHQWEQNDRAVSLQEEKRKVKSKALQRS